MAYNGPDYSNLYQGFSSDPVKAVIRSLKDNLRGALLKGDEQAIGRVPADYNNLVQVLHGLHDSSSDRRYVERELSSIAKKAGKRKYRDGSVSARAAQLASQYAGAFHRPSRKREDHKSIKGGLELAVEPDHVEEPELEIVELLGGQFEIRGNQ